MQYVQYMKKSNKKQRQIVKRESFDIVSANSQLHSENSSSILPLEYPHQQNVMPQQTESSPQFQPSQIKIKPKQIPPFELEAQSPEQLKRNKRRIKSIRKNIQKVINEESEQKKETDATHQSIIEAKVINNKQIMFQENIQKTQHYSYHGEQQDSQSDDSRQEQQLHPQFQMPTHKKKKTQIPKTFVAQNFNDLIFSQIPPNCTVTAVVYFKHEFLSMKRQYSLYLVNEKKYLLTAVKSRMKLASQFSFSRKQTNSESSFGYLKSNFTGLQYVLNKVHRNENNRISELCWIGYDLNLIGLANQRNITVLKNTNAKLEKIPYFSQIKSYYENGITNKFQKFITRNAVVNKLGDYELDFHNKVTIPSAMNFILTDNKDKECILFGKRRDNTFILQISHPFSIFQGFAIAISNLDHKLFVR